MPILVSPLNLVAEYALPSSLAHTQTIPPIPASYMSAGIVSPLFSTSANTLNKSVEEKVSPKKNGDTTPKVLDMISGMDNNDVDMIVEMDYASDRSLCWQPRLQAPQALAIHPSANQAPQDTSHPRGNPRLRSNAQASLSSA